jgi:hypothetical protein
LKVNRRFEGKYRLNLQGQRISRARNQRESSWQAEPSRWFLALLTFRPWRLRRYVPPKRRVTSGCHTSPFPSLLGFPLFTLPYPPLLFSPVPRLTGLLPRERFELVARGLGLCLRWGPHLSNLNLFLYTFRPRTFYAQRQWTWQGFLLVLILLFSYIILFISCIHMFIVIIFTCCFILVYFIWRALLHPSLSQFDRTDLCGSRAFSCFRVQLLRGVLVCFRWSWVDLTRGGGVQSVDSQPTTRRYIPEDSTLHNHRCENLKSYKRCFVTLQAGLCGRVHESEDLENFPWKRNYLPLNLSLISYLKRLVRAGLTSGDFNMKWMARTRHILIDSVSGQL